MNKKYILISSLVLVVVLSGFFIVRAISGDRMHSEQDGVKVAATIFPVYDIVRNVAGDNVDVELLLPPGASPHFYEFTPRQLQELQGASVIFAIGHTADDWALTAKDAIDGIEVVVVDDGIHLRETGHDDGGHHEDEHHDEEHHGDNHDEDEHYGDEHHEDNHHEDEHHGDDHHEDDHHDNDHHDHAHGPTDPHYWLHFENARKIADTVAAHLSELDPDNTEEYLANAEAFKAELQAKEAELKEAMSVLENRNIITLHDAWYYFADNFDLEVVGTFEPSAGEEPSPRFLANLRQSVVDNNVRVIFGEPQLGTESLQNFARDNDLSLAIIDPVGGVEGRSSFIELMEYNVNRIIDSL